MTDGGGGDFEVHPGDPWSPGWTDDAVEQPGPRRGDAPAPGKKRRRFGRKRREAEPAVDEFPTEEHVAYSEPTVQPEARFTTAPAFEPEAAPPPPPVTPAAVAAEPPMPAWLSDPPRPEPAPLPVELPAWVGHATAGAEVVAAGFEDAAPSAPAPTAVPPAERPAAADLSEALAALGGDIPEIEVAPEVVAETPAADAAAINREAFEALRRLEAEEEPVAVDDPFEVLRRLEAEAGTEPPVASPDAPAITGRYGVAGKEAFAALGDADGEDLADWEAFAGAGAEPSDPGRDGPARQATPPAATPPAEPAAVDEWADAEPEPRRKRGIWPFRRHREVEEEAVYEEATEWTEADAAPAPEWFADIDEDEVVPPTVDLPETEWPPPPEPGPAAITEAPVAVPPPQQISPSAVVREPPVVIPPTGTVETGEQPPLDFATGAVPLVAVPPSRLPEPEVVRPLREVPAPADEITPPATGAVAEPGADVVDLGPVESDDSTVELPAPPPYLEEAPYASPGRREAFAEGEEFGEVEQLPEAGPVEADDIEDLRAGGPWRLDFDDGTAESPYGASAYDPAPAPAVRGDRDIWEGASDWDPEATVEMTDPGLVLSEDIYGRAGTIEHRGLAEEIFRLGEEDTEWQAMSAAMPGIETGVVGFEDVADLSTGERYEEAPRSDLGARIGTGLLLLVFLLGTMFVGGAAMAVFIGAMALLGIWEFYGTLRRLEFQPLTLLGYVGGLGLLAAVWFHGPVAIPVALSLLVVVTFFVYAFSPLRQDALANGGLTVLAVGWVAGTVAFATPILRQDDFRVLVMAVVAATVAMDVGAFSFGRTWGSRALAPLVSPNKSVEGLLGGVLLTMGAGVAIGMFAEPFDLRSGIALGIVVSVMAPLGDLAESMIKRSLGVKDMGTILPGHGGVLDRIDGFLFVLPAAWLLYQVTGFLG